MHGPSGERRLCPVCGTPAAVTREVPGKTGINGRPLTLASCPRCGTVYQPIVPAADDLARWYDHMGAPDKLAREPSPLFGKRLDRLLASLERHRVSGRLLDVGCGRGELVLRARELGWDVHATEISPSCVAALRPMLGQRIHAGSLVDAPFAPESFDLVVMVEVIEHLVDPAEYLRASWRLLRPGGSMFLTTPNLRGLSGLVRGVRWRVVADEHLAYFDESTLAALLRLAGFRDVQVTTTGLDLPAVVSRMRRVAPQRTRRERGAPRAGACDSGEARVADLAIELANAGLRLVHLGDTIRAFARRPS